MLKRRRFRQTETLAQRLSQLITKLRKEAQRTPPGTERERLIRRVLEAESALRLVGWLNSPGLQPPK